MLSDRVHDLRAAFRYTKKKWPYSIDAIVVLPEHLHAVMTLPEGDVNYPRLWRSIKAEFTKRINNAGIKTSINKRGEHDVWQKRYWEHTIRNESNYQSHVDYVHINPVKHGLVKQVSNWPYSSFHRYVRLGLLPIDWAGCVRQHANYDFGEDDPGLHFIASGLR